MNNLIDGLSMNIEQTNLDKLRSVFPECVSEGKLDIDKLLSLCGEYIDNDFEKYKFEWKGKADCLRLAQKRSTGTLRPCPEESVNWDTTQNLYIEGDNLEVLKLLQTAYYRKVKMIYIDPPYNTGNDFVYADDFADPMARYKEVTQQTTKSNPETMGRFHTNWLNMMYPRLRLAANLLRDDGVIFISIDDAELYNLKKICDEVFGEENYVATLVYDKNRKNDAKYFSVGHEYMLVYFKSAATIYEKGIVLRATKEGIDEVKEEFQRLRTLYNDDWTKVNEGLKALYASWPADDPRKSLARFTRVDEKGPYRDDGNINWPGGGGPMYDVIHPITGKVCKKPVSGWRYPTPERLQEEIEKGHVVFGKDETTVPRVRMNLFEADKEVLRSVHFSYAQTATNEFVKIFDGKRVFENPKSIDDIKKLVEYITAKNDSDIVLDFFSGSATTAHAVMQLNAEDGGNRRFILVQLPELCDEKSEAYKAGYKNICEIGKERIRRAGKKIAETIYEEKFAVKIGGHTVTSLAPAVEIIQPKEKVVREIQKELKGIDVGFKAFKLDTSNLKTWDATPIEDEQLDLLYRRMNSMIHRVKPERTDLDMIYEIMLKLGVPLTYSVTSFSINNKTVYGVGDDCLLLICLAENVQPEDVEQMTEYAPAKIIISRDSFADDTAMANAYYILRDHGIELKLV
ncbi:site-specific DNA-methyltransferase [Pseudoflavonifractor sp. CLA-AP-H29]|uniref:Site-specific DNA-methyltransferase n=1 Tax=Pseudoflavonifractor intestinihominis TaxID=3133171 RepID=A0ABV1EAE5_9FIRM